MKDESGDNLLHEAVQVTRLGRTGVSSECRQKMVRLVAINDELTFQTNKEGKTPFEMARYFTKTPESWGSGITADRLLPLLVILEPIDVKPPVLFYSSEKSLLSKNVLKFLMKYPLLGPITLLDIKDTRSFRFLHRTTTKSCKLEGGLIHGVPLLWDGKSCHTSDTGVLSWIKENSKIQAAAVR